MKKLFPLLAFVFAFSISMSVSAQNDSNVLEMFQLKESNLPSGYQFTPKMSCQSKQAAALFRNISSFNNEFGEIAHTAYQSFRGNGETGSILYFQFKDAKDFKQFLDDYLWGKAGNPTSKHPEEYMIFRKNILIVYSVSQDSPLKKASHDMIEQLK